jgi:eukaryotic-like serine/threonine-protein kinase
MTENCPRIAAFLVAFMLTFALNSVLFAGKDGAVVPPKTKTTTVMSPVSDAKGGPMVEIAAACFTMGSATGSEDEKPRHRVCLDKYHIDLYEVTNAQYDLCHKAGGCPKAHYADDTCYVTGESDWSKTRTVQAEFTRPNHPAVCIDWEQAATFCAWAGKRLPTEAEWEYAARGSDGRIYPWGNDLPSCRLAVMNSDGRGCSRGTTSPVGSKYAGVSPFGLYDMAGNAWEWVADWHEENYYSHSPEKNPRGPASSSAGKRVFRGGSWYNKDNELRSSYRTQYLPGYRYDYYGFRCAR